MLKNRAIFAKDPTTYKLPNDGVSAVGNPTTLEEWNVLAYELSNFVCQGEYEHGLQLILTTFLDNRDKSKQPAAWVSGFYGSGKSHFVRVLEHLWKNTELPQGGNARALATSLSQDIRDSLTELSIAGNREGGLWAAAGALSTGSVKSVRLALLGIILKSANLPEQYAPARFVVWLAQQGYYRDVKATVERKGSSLEHELKHMYMSSMLAESLLEVDPQFASNTTEARSFLKAQYPPKEDISENELLDMIADVLALQSKTPGKLPCTLLIFDELQQYLGDDNQKTVQLQTIVEACSARFENKLLFLATGQADMLADAQLQKLHGRFTVRISLSDNDVQQVVREVVLSKQPVYETEVREILKEASGEIRRQLAGSKIAPEERDQEHLVADYPLLPTRSRFWERLLRSINSLGLAGQLRTQLRITYEAIRHVADAPLGTVVAGDFIYNQLKSEMLQSGVLLRDIATVIEQVNDGTADGLLSSRLCATIFLLSKLETSGDLASGLTATVETLADLLVEDIRDINANTRLRQAIPPLLQRLVDSGRVMHIGDEYRLQTREGSEWEQDFQRRRTNIANNLARVADERAEAFESAVRKTLKIPRLTQGASKTPRDYELHFDSRIPPAISGKVPVWVRDGWSVTARNVLDEARSAGVDSPIVFLFLPKQDVDALKQAISEYLAAKETLETHQSPATDAAKEAENAMKSRCQSFLRKRDALINEIVNHAQVYQGGGNEVTQGSLVESVKKAIEDSLVRLFPKFALADHGSWETVVRRCTQGGADPLAVVGYSGAVNDHAASREMLPFIGGSGKKGSEIRKYCEGAPYGWPRDAVDGILLSLLGEHFVRAARNGDPVALKDLNQQQLGQVDFFLENISLGKQQIIGVRGLLTKLGMPPKNNNEAELISQALHMLIDLAKRAGGDAPLPARPSTEALNQLQMAGGNDQFLKVYQERDELQKNFSAWTAIHQKIELRAPRWQELTRLFFHASSLPVFTEVEPQRHAILQNRSILVEPDPVLPLLNKVAATLRQALLDKHRRLVAAQEQESKVLEHLSEWQSLSEAKRQSLLRQAGLGPVENLVFSTNEELLATLDATPLANWEDKIAALKGRVQTVREEAAKYLLPKESFEKVIPAAATIRTLAETEAYLNTLRAAIVEHIEAGHTVII